MQLFSNFVLDTVIAVEWYTSMIPNFVMDLIINNEGDKNIYTVKIITKVLGSGRQCNNYS